MKDKFIKQKTNSISKANHHFFQFKTNEINKCLTRLTKIREKKDTNIARNENEGIAMDKAVI